MLYLICLDSNHLGRINPSMLSDQQFMELFFTSDDADQSHARFGGDIDDACTWNGVTCNDNKQITEIIFLHEYIELYGGINFKMIPPHVTDLSITNEPLYGEADVSGLPNKMETLVIEACRFTGTLDLSSLPQNLRMFSFAFNNITEVKNLCNIPQSVMHLRVSEPGIVKKSLHVGKLPANRLILRLTRCGFTDITYDNPKDKRRMRLG